MTRPQSVRITPAFFLSWAFSLLVLAVSASGAEYQLFSPPSDVTNFSVTRSLPPTASPRAQRERTVAINPLVTAPGHLAKGDVLSLPLFSDAVYIARVDRVTRNSEGSITVRARLEGLPMACLLISTTNGRSLASIEIPEHGSRYLVEFDPRSGTHRLLDATLVREDALEDAPPLIPPLPEPESLPRAMPFSSGPLDPATISVMIVYTPAAKSWAGGESAIANVIAQAMAKAQLACDNSNTLITMELVHAAEVTYTESSSSSTDLSRLTSTSDGYMDAVHTWRTQYGADLVCLFTRVEDVGGIGWLLSWTGGSPGYAFSISRVQQASWTYTTIHEMGHNMGCHHHKLQTTQPGPGLFSYSAGWRWTGSNGGKYCSVMTYENGSYFPDGVTHTRVGYFSDPDVSYFNTPTGHAQDGDNARTLREIKHVIAAYRAPNSPPSTPSLVSPDDGSAGLGLTPTLQASAFFDSDGDTHANSRWQADDNSDFSSPEWDSGDAYTAGTQATVPSGRLGFNNTYHWRVRYKDGRGLWSNWSASRVFHTFTDTDADGVPDDSDDCPDTPAGTPVGIRGCPLVPGDFNNDTDVDQSDFAVLQRCLGMPPAGECAAADLDQSGVAVDHADVAVFMHCMSGTAVPAESDCAN